MAASANTTGSGFRRALTESLHTLGERFDREIQIAKRDVGGALNLAIRRLRLADSEKAWSEALADGISGFSHRGAVFAVENAGLRLLASRGLSGSHAHGRISLDSASAVSSVIQTGEPVVALRDPRELSNALLELIGGASGERVHLFPVFDGTRVCAILYTDADTAEVDVGCIEVLAAASGAILESARSRWAKSAGLIAIGSAPQAERSPKSWDELSRGDREIHLRAQRMARVQIAQMRLYLGEAVLKGHADKDLYRHLREPIDLGRERFRKDFLEVCASMVDYFHLELVRTLAHDDARLLGPDYPGPAIN